MNAGDQNSRYPEPTAGMPEVLRDAPSVKQRAFANEEASPEQIAIFRRMTLEQRWQAARRLYWTCRRHKAAFLQSQHPDWSQPQVDNEVRRIFQNART